MAEEIAAASAAGWEQEKWISHYSSSHRILLVGEGDFSFSACLARAFGSAKKMVATSYDSEERVLEKHRSAKNHLYELRMLGCTVLHGINVKDMHECPLLNLVRFDRIVFNFPHAGHAPYLKESDDELIRRHRELLRDFFSSAKWLVNKGGEVHVTHRDDLPYARWRIISSARKRGLMIKEKALFEKKEYPGYHHKRGGDIKGNKTFPIGLCCTFKFAVEYEREEREEESSLSLGKAPNVDLVEVFGDLVI
ncbi:hypothetical protein HPP92_007498 [Vanilla planifolia]|uniref:25S rRNA (uridine-N(3))-methyltransferase BMT5-like domain-containing protein n=1 Tax=Vanilla planifolia TaxID=51239 RepID=A0A835RMJ8_VANPL|nr:hypothetical protein HPP92_007498 [Vanilla planifolia]